MTDLSLRIAEEQQGVALRPHARRAGRSCPRCGRPDALRATRTDSGRRLRCRFAGDGSCDWEGVDRPFAHQQAERIPAAFVERLARIAERVVAECAQEGVAAARIDPHYVTSLRAAVRRAAHDRDLHVRTAHLGEGLVEVRTM